MKLDQMSVITNVCDCEQDCYGICWEDSLMDFTYALADFVADNPTGEFRIEGFPIWSGRVDGSFYAVTVRHFLECITPQRTAWTLRYGLNGDTLECFLAHHDASGAMTITYKATDSE